MVQIFALFNIPLAYSSKMFLSWMTSKTCPVLLYCIFITIISSNTSLASSLLPLALLYWKEDALVLTETPIFRDSHVLMPVESMLQVTMVHFCTNEFFGGGEKPNTGIKVTADFSLSAFSKAGSKP